MEPCKNADIKNTSVPSKNTLVRFGPEIIPFCRYIADSRQSNNEKAKVTNRRFSLHRSDADINYQGVVGEVALLHLFHQSLEPLTNTTPCCALRDRFDMVFDGLTVDVKCTFPGYPLLVKKHKRINPPDVYVLLTVENLNTLPTVTYRGCIKAKELFVPHKFGPGPGGEGYRAAVDELVDWPVLNA